jgi:hypothetical protein
MPIVRSQKDILIPENNKISKQQQKRVFQASLTKILFIKKGNNISVRELIMVPEYDYLNEKNFDISDNNFYNLDKKFRGNILISNWKDDFLTGYKMIDGKISKKISFEKKNKNQLARQWTITKQETVDGCLREKTEFWKQDCTIMTLQLGDGDEYTYTKCGEEELVDETEWIIIYCDPPPFEECEDPSLSFEECLCLQLGGSLCDDENPEPEPDPNPNPNDEEECKITLDDANQFESDFKSISPDGSEVQGSLFSESSLSTSGTKEIIWDHKVFLIDYNNHDIIYPFQQKWYATYRAHWIYDDNKQAGKKVCFDVFKKVEFSTYYKYTPRPSHCIKMDLSSVSVNTASWTPDHKQITITSTHEASLNIKCMFSKSTNPSWPLVVDSDLSIDPTWRNL